MTIEEHFAELKRLSAEGTRLADEFNRLVNEILAADWSSAQRSEAGTRLDELLKVSSTNSAAFREILKSLRELCRGIAEWASIDDL